MSETKIEEWRRKIRNGERREAEHKKAGYEAKKAETWKRLSEPFKRPNRKLQASWTLDAIEDSEALHSLDLEKELAEALCKEIDKEIFQDLSRTTKNRPYGNN